MQPLQLNPLQIVDQDPIRDWFEFQWLWVQRQIVYKESVGTSAYYAYLQQKWNGIAENKYIKYL